MVVFAGNFVACASGITFGPMLVGGAFVRECAVSAQMFVWSRVVVPALHCGPCNTMRTHAVFIDDEHIDEARSELTFQDQTQA